MLILFVFFNISGVKRFLIIWLLILKLS